LEGKLQKFPCLSRFCSFFFFLSYNFQSHPPTHKTNLQATPLAKNPTPNDLFQPLTFQYYANTVLHATWPAFVGLGAFVVLLLAFTLWRLLSACARCSQRRKLKEFFPTNSISSTASFKSRKQKARSVKGKTAIALRWILSLLFLGVVAGCIYGMVNINTELINDGLETVGEVQSYAQNVLDSLGDIVSAGNAIDTALFNTQDIVDVNINVTGKLLLLLLFIVFFG
jgi:hypothetical protein